MPCPPVVAAASRFGHYRRLPALREYVLVAQDHFSVEVCLCQADEARNTEASDHWLLLAITEPTTEVPLGSLGVSVPLAEI